MMMMEWSEQEAGWLQRQTEAYRKERSVIRITRIVKAERENVTRDEGRVLRGG